MNHGGLLSARHYMRQEMQRAFNSPWEKIDTIYNGIRPEKKLKWHEFDAWNFHRRFAADDQKIVYYVGRITHEKGMSVLLNAAPKVVEEMGGNVKLAIVGGGNTDALKLQGEGSISLFSPSLLPLPSSCLLPGACHFCK